MFPNQHHALFFPNRRDLDRAQQMRAFIRRRNLPGSNGDAFGDLFMPAVRPDPWRQNAQSPNTLNPNRFEDLNISSPALTHSQYSSSDEDVQTSYPPHPPRRNKTPNHHTSHPSNKSNNTARLPFETAAATLAEALETFRKYFDCTLREFRDETFGIAFYASPRVLDALWELKLDWNGVPGAEAASTKRKPGVVTFAEQKEKLLRALEGMRGCTPPGRDGRVEKSDEEVAAVGRRLQASMESLGEFLEAVGRHRDRVPAFSKELELAGKLMGEVTEFGRRKEKQEKGGRIERREEDWEWEGYRSD